jgi:hypothetical protein
MDNLFLRSTSAEALRAELHHVDLLREAATTRWLRATTVGTTLDLACGPGLVSRVRTALAGVGRPAQVDCPDCV